MSESFTKDFKRFFLSGLTAVLPTLLTIAIIVWVLTMIQDYVGQHINVVAKWCVVQFRTINGIRVAGATGTEGPRTWWQILIGPKMQWERTHQIWRTYHLGWVGFVLAFVVIYIFGRFVGSLVGKSIWRVIERAFLRTPVVRGIYPSVKQVTDFLLAERKMEASRVVAVEYPRKGVWSVGLVTGPGMRTLQNANEGTYLTVFIPSSPTPVTGYTITVRRDEVIDLPVHIDDALRFTISGGVIMPINEQLTAAEIEQARLGALPPLMLGKEQAE